MKSPLLLLVCLVLIYSCKTTQLASKNQETWECTFQGTYGDFGENGKIKEFTQSSIKDEDKAASLAAASCEAYFKNEGIEKFTCKFKKCQHKIDRDGEITGKTSGNNSGDETWYSEKYDRYFDENGECSQYNDTDSKTCQTRKDNLNCDWKKSRKECRPD